jgi:hypothetical protein
MAKAKNSRVAFAGTMVGWLRLWWIAAFAGKGKFAPYF